MSLLATVLQWIGGGGRKPRCLVKPKLTGTAKIGATLTVTRGVWA